jgi:hypothetical protein
MPWSELVLKSGTGCLVPEKSVRHSASNVNARAKMALSDVCQNCQLGSCQTLARPWPVFLGFTRQHFDDPLSYTTQDVKCCLRSHNFQLSLKPNRRRGAAKHRKRITLLLSSAVIFLLATESSISSSGVTYPCGTSLLRALWANTNLRHQMSLRKGAPKIVGLRLRCL